MPQPTRRITSLCLCALLAEGAAQCTAPPRPPVTHIPSKSRWASWKGAQPLPTVTNSKEMSSFSLTLASFYVTHPAPCLSTQPHPHSPTVSPPPGSAQINKNTTLSQICTFYWHTELHSQMITEKQYWVGRTDPLFTITMIIIIVPPMHLVDAPNTTLHLTAIHFHPAPDRISSSMP